MKKKSTQYTLLNKEDDYNGEIELQDLSMKIDQDKSYEPAPYLRLDEKYDENPEKKQSTPQPKTQEPAQSKPRKTHIYHINAQQPSVYRPNRKTRIAVQPHLLRSQPQQVPTIKNLPVILPEKKVACKTCTFQQMVPGNSTVFVCCMCSAMNDCPLPQFGLFICFMCKNRVSYPYRTSQFIRCGMCGNINKVPLEPNEEKAPQKAKENKPKEEKKEEAQSSLIEEILDEKPKIQNRYIEIEQEEDLQISEDHVKEEPLLQERVQQKEKQKTSLDFQYPAFD